MFVIYNYETISSKEKDDRSVISITNALDGNIITAICKKDCTTNNELTLPIKNWDRGNCVLIIQKESCLLYVSCQIT